MILPTYINKAIKKLEEGGFQAFVVGGAVRDSLLGLEPKDYDITTDASPDEIEKVFEGYKIINIGKSFGTILVIIENSNVEITTFRLDGEYKDGRRPKEVVFSNNLVEDLRRRDFTINAMAYNGKTGIIDVYDGKRDLKNKIIRTVNKPEKRFQEDYLRILRCIRFASQYKFKIEEDTYEAIKKYKNNLKSISVERIRDEIFKIIKSDNTIYGLELLKDTGILNLVFPEVAKMIGFNQQNPNHDYDLYTHTLKVVENTKNDLVLRLASLFHDLGKIDTFFIDNNGLGHFYGHEKISSELSREILKRYNTPKDIINKVSLLIENHMVTYHNMKKKGYKRLISRLGEENIFLLLDLQIADRLGTQIEERSIEDLLKAKETIKDIINNKEVYDKKQLAIDGSHVIELGYVQGRQIGIILDYALDKVLENEDLNQKDILFELIEKKFKKD